MASSQPVHPVFSCYADRKLRRETADLLQPFFTCYLIHCIEQLKQEAIRASVHPASLAFQPKARERGGGGVGDCSTPAVRPGGLRLLPSSVNPASQWSFSPGQAGRRVVEQRGTAALSTYSYHTNVLLNCRQSSSSSSSSSSCLHPLLSVHSLLECYLHCSGSGPGLAAAGLHAGCSFLLGAAGGPGRCSRLQHQALQVIYQQDNEPTCFILR